MMPRTPYTVSSVAGWHVADGFSTSEILSVSVHVPPGPGGYLFAANDVAAIHVRARETRSRAANFFMGAPLGRRSRSTVGKDERSGQACVASMCGAEPVRGFGSHRTLTDSTDIRSREKCNGRPA